MGTAHFDLSECDLNYFLDLIQTESISYEDKDLPPTASPTSSNWQYLEDKCYPGSSPKLPAPPT